MSKTLADYSCQAFTSEFCLLFPYSDNETTTWLQGEVKGGGITVFTYGGKGPLCSPEVITGGSLRFKRDIENHAWVGEKSNKIQTRPSYDDVQLTLIFAEKILTPNWHSSFPFMQQKIHSLGLYSQWLNAKV